MKKLGLLLGVVIIILSGCSNRQNDNSSEIKKDYAVNKVTTSVTTEASLAENTTSEITTTAESIIIDEQEFSYNVDDDVNANKITSLNSISIDGKICSFPVTYTNLKANFGNLYTTIQNRYGVIFNDIDETAIAKEFSVEAKPTTGQGTIRFIFTSDEPTTIDKMICKQVILFGGSLDNSKSMTIALPGNIHFGSTYKEIVDVFSTPTVQEFSGEEDDNKSNFNLLYQFDNLNCDCTFVGYDGGLNSIILNF